MPSKASHNEIIIFQVVVIMVVTFVIIYFAPSVFPTTGNGRDINKIYESLSDSLQKGMITIIVLAFFLFLQQHFGLVSL